VSGRPRQRTKYQAPDRSLPIGKSEFGLGSQIACYKYATRYTKLVDNVPITGPRNYLAALPVQTHNCPLTSKSGPTICSSPYLQFPALPAPILTLIGFLKPTNTSIISSYCALAVALSIHPSGVAARPKNTRRG
jgi:hypothetical protein